MHCDARVAIYPLDMLYSVPEKTEAQLSLTNRAVLVCTVVEVWQDFLSEYVDEKFTWR